MTAIVLAALSAFCFGLMTVFVRLGLTAGVPPAVGAFLTIAPACLVTAAATLVRGDVDLSGAWPFVLAGLLAPAAAQLLFTFAVRDAGASRSSVTVGTAPLVAVAIALIFLDEPLVAGLVAGAALIVAGGILLASDRARPEHFKRIGIVYALLCTFAFATRDSLIRWLGTEASDIDPGPAAFVTMLTATVATLGFAYAAGNRISVREVRAFVPAGLCYGLSYVFLFEAFYRGRVSVVSPIVATESLWGVTLSWLLLRKSELVGPRLFVGAALVVAGGVLIGLYR